jgi:Zn-dependent M28 family amino/carboxypeptidase
MFNLFGAEEQAVAGSEYYLKHPVYPLDKTVCLLNMDMVGTGERLSATAGGNYPSLWVFIEKNNAQLVHRQLSTSSTENLGRPRTDAARFLWENVPTLSFASGGGGGSYHTPDDTPDKLNPELMEDLARILFLAILDIANQDTADFRKDVKK